jgi:Holliday junction resolvase-like predicted endonuclease
MAKEIQNSSRLGDIAEHYVITWLWDEGFEVFPNAGCSGPIDMIAVKGGVPVFIDVKSRNDGNNFTRERSELQKKIGVRHVFFNGKTRKCRWVEHRV